MKYNQCRNWCVSNALALSLICIFKDPYLFLQMLKDVISFAYTPHTEQIFFLAWLGIQASLQKLCMLSGRDVNSGSSSLMGEGETGNSYTETLSNCNQD